MIYWEIAIKNHSALSGFFVYYINLFSSIDKIEKMLKHLTSFQFYHIFVLRIAKNNIMKKTIILLVLFATSFVTYSQNFTSNNSDFINIDSKELKIDIDDFSYKGYFESFKSKKDKKEYLIYSYFSRSVILAIDRPLKSVDNDTQNLKINSVLVVHSSEISAIKKSINKKGLKNLKDYILVYQSDNFNKILDKSKK